MQLQRDSQGREVVPIIINNVERPLDTTRVLPVKNSVSGEAFISMPAQTRKLVVVRVMQRGAPFEPGEMHQ